MFDKRDERLSMAFDKEREPPPAPQKKITSEKLFEMMNITVEKVNG